MNANMNDIAGFDAMTEEVRQVYAERDQYKALLDELKKYFKMTAPHWKYSDIPHFVKTAHEFALENKEAAKDALREFAEDICKILGVDYDMSTDATIFSEVKRLRESVDKQEEFTEEAASILGVHPGDLSLSDILDALRKLKRYENLNNMNCEIIAERLISLKDKYDKETDRRIEAERYISDSLSKICSALGIEYSTDTTLEYILDTIDDVKARSLEFNLRTENFRHFCDILGLEPKDTVWANIFNEVEDLRAKYLNLCGDFACCCDKLGLDSTERNRSSVMKKIDDMRAYTDALKADTIHHDKRRREWVRKYKSEHERANHCDELYKKYKALYDADAPKREKLSDDLQTYRASYEAIKNKAVKNRSLMNTVANIVGTVGMHDDVTLTGVLNARKKANHWDILVDGYGERTIRSLLENINVDVSGDKGNGLF